MAAADILHAPEPANHAASFQIAFRVPSTSVLSPEAWDGPCVPVSMLGITSMNPASLWADNKAMLDG